VKAKRFIIEYANSKIKLYEQLKKEYPEQASDYNRMINVVDRAVWSVERGYITDDEAIRLILESASAKY
jgi:hypothetical protein